MNKTENIATEKNQSSILLAVYQVRGIQAFNTKDFDSAIPFYNSCIEIATELNDTFSILISHYNLGICYFKVNQLTLAKKHLIESLKMKSGSRLKRSYLYLSLIHANNDHEQSLVYLAKYDSIDNALKNKKEEELLVKYESLEKEKENLALILDVKEKELQAENYRLESQKNKIYLVIGIIISALLIIAGFLFYRFKRIQAKNKIQTLEKQALQLQLNPHFFFNALNSINSYIGDNDTNKAKYYLSKFSRLMRSTLENSSLAEVSLGEELEFIENYMLLEQMNTIHFSYSINVKEELLDITIPSMLLQPFIENSIEHAFNELNENGTIRIDINLLDNLLEIKITDNGIGISNQNTNSTHKSLAIEILRKRIKIYSKNKSKIEFKIPFPDNKNKGAQVVFKIPVKI